MLGGWLLRAGVVVLVLGGTHGDYPRLSAAILPGLAALCAGHRSGRIVCAVGATVLIAAFAKSVKTRGNMSFTALDKCLG
jgi:hypothetical protein